MCTQSFVRAGLLAVAITGGNCAIASPEAKNIPEGQSIDWVSFTFMDTLARYSDIKECLLYTSEQLKVDAELLMSVLAVENGKEKLVSKNSNGTNDYGYFQINDVRIPELEKIGISRDMLIKNQCVNTFAAGFILKYELNKANGFWEGVGNYHYGLWGENPNHHHRYRKKVRTAWQAILTRWRNKT